MRRTESMCMGLLLAILAPVWAAEPAGPVAGDEATPEHESVTEKSAAEKPPEPTSIWERRLLLGDLGGLRSDLESHGVTFKIGITQVFQNNARGGRRTRDGAKYSGSADIDITLDTGRMGLWQGGSLLLHGEPKWGNGIDSLVGSLSPINTDAIKPGTQDSCQMNLAEIIYSQAFFPSKQGPPKLILVGGKLDGSRVFDMNAFANDERTQFLNGSLRNNPVIPPFLPYTNWGAGFILNPCPYASLITAVADSQGDARHTNFDTAFHGPTHTTVIQELVTRFEPFGKPGNFRIGWVWTSMEKPDLQPPTPFKETADLVIGALGLERANKLVSMVAPPVMRPDNVAMFTGFDQFVYTEPGDAKQGVGLFGRFGWARNDVNPIDTFYSIGVGGRGVVPTRDRDTFGIGYYYLNLSNGLPSLFSDEQGLEAFYNIEITPWLHVSPDIQWIVNPGGADQHDNAIVVGLRTQIDL